MPTIGGSSYRQQERPSPVVQQQRPGTTANANGSYSEGNAGWPYFQTTGPPPPRNRTRTRTRTRTRPSLNAQTQGIYGL